MPRQLRIQYPGAIYHVLSRGDRREKIFLDDVDRQDWHGKNRAERIIAEELATLGWKEEDLARRRKSDPAQLAMAARLRRETSMPLNRITARIHLGTSKSANAKVHQWIRNNPTTGVSSPLLQMQNTQTTVRSPEYA